VTLQQGCVYVGLPKHGVGSHRHIPWPCLLREAGLHSLFRTGGLVSSPVYVNVMDLPGKHGSELLSSVSPTFLSLPLQRPHASLPS
jgi:hypothetical protein